MSVTDPRGPSIDLRTTKAKAKKKGADGQERLAHRGCNTGKGAKDPVVPWPEPLFVVDQAVLLTAVERSEERRVGKEGVTTCRSRWCPFHQKNKKITIYLLIRYK